ncbi:MAG TPA: metal ABC transporter permease [Spirochaetota bacterium]|nr:metal ABC transporter permease [Spirochaetota bacterium]
MSELFSYGFLTTALIVTLLAAASTALLSVFVTLRKLSFMSNALSHVSFAGIALALWTGIGMHSAVLAVVIIVALLTGFLNEYYKVKEENIITVFLAVAMASAVIMLSLTENYTINITSYLFGDILLVEHKDVYRIAVMLLLNFLFIICFFKELFYMCYNQETAAAYGIPVRVIYYVFLIFLAVNIVLTVKIVGIILITAQFILPGITALNITDRIKPAIISSLLISEVAGLGGFGISFYFSKIPTGSMIVIILFLIYLLSFIIKKIRVIN